MLKEHDMKVVNKLKLLSMDNPVNLRCSHVAALYHKKRLISVGVNKTKTHPLSFKLSGLQHKKYLHAEVDCLIGVDGNLSKHTLYVVRADRNGELAQSKPCEHCQTYIKELGVGRVVHTIPRGIVEDFL